MQDGLKPGTYKLGEVNVFAYLPTRRRLRTDRFEWVEGTPALIIACSKALGGGYGYQMAPWANGRANLKFSGAGYILKGGRVALSHGSDGETG